MRSSEWITWMTCPECGGQAAVGWSGARPVEFDCVNGCGLTVDRLQGTVEGPSPDTSGLAGGG